MRLAFRVESGEASIALLAEEHGDTLRAATADGALWVEFAVAKQARYTTLTIRDWQGIGEGKGSSLHVSVPAASRLWLTELDYMGTYRENDDARQISWLSPSKHFGVNPSGAFAVFEADSDEAYDETLLRIWVNEAQPHPNVGAESGEGDGKRSRPTKKGETNEVGRESFPASKEWTLDYARQWLADWQQTFGKRSQMVVNGESLQELYDLVPYAEKAGIDEIYIFTNTWRPDPFWPISDVNWALNSNVFPHGRADLRAYSDYLAKRGIRLALHYVSGGMGLHDPVYVTPNPHPDLAAWGVGKLPVEIDEVRDAFSVSPGAGMTWPLHERAHFSDLVLQIGNELIAPGDTVEDTDGCWSLTECERGAYGTVAGVHQQGCDVKFLVMPYGINLVPDNNSDLLYEVADNYASLLNDCNIAHAEFDGAEIHCYDGNYGYIKFAQRIYEKTDHAISGHDSSASAPRCFFEYRFKSTERALRGKCGFTHGNWLVPFQVDSASRPASTVLDANFFLSQGHWGGAMGLSKPEPMFGITTAMVAAHGLPHQFLETLHDWKLACRRLTDDQHRLIEDSLDDPDWPMPEASSHRVADTVYTVRRRDGKVDGKVSRPTTGNVGRETFPASARRERTGDAPVLRKMPSAYVGREPFPASAQRERTGRFPVLRKMPSSYVGRERLPASDGDAYELVPVRVMTRASGDIKWQLGQEYGPLSPRQFVRSGESIELINPFADQSPAFVLRVLPGFDRGTASIPASALSSEADAVFDDKDFFVEGNEPDRAHEGSRREGFPSYRENIDVMPSAFDGVLQASNEGSVPEYHVRDLPLYPLRVDLSAHRGLGIEVQGDGRGALLLVQLEGHGCRDYVIPVDFEGVRTVEVPCGEVSWARADWGWRMGTKTMNYAAVAQCRIGLGMVPAQSSVSIRVRSLTALAERSVPLVTPSIWMGETCLDVEGSIATGNYLVYTGGETADVYDPNWHHVDAIPVSRRDLLAQTGSNVARVEAQTEGATPWLDVQFLVKDTPITLG